MNAPAALAEVEIDRARRCYEQRIRPASVMIGHERDNRRGPALPQDDLRAFYYTVDCR